MASSSRGYGIPVPSTPVPQQIFPNDRAYSTSGRRNQYFVPGEGIKREVIQADICKYLDNDATVRPGVYQNREGYMLYAYRNLTSAMLEDIRRDSRSYDREIEKSKSKHSGRERSGRHAGHSDLNPVQQYEKSRTYHDRHSDQNTSSPINNDYPGHSGPPSDDRGGPQPPYYQDTTSYASQQRAGAYAQGSQSFMMGGYGTGYDTPQGYQNDPRAPPQYGYNQSYQQQPNQQPYSYGQPGPVDPRARAEGYQAPQQPDARQPGPYDYADPRFNQPGMRPAPAVDPRYGDPRIEPSRQPDQRYTRR